MHTCVAKFFCIAIHIEATIKRNVVILRLTVPIFAGIKLSVKGEADTYWSTDRQELNNEGRYINETDVVTGHEEYFKAQFYLLGSSSSKQYL